MLVSLVAAMALAQTAPQQQVTSCGWEYGRWVCRDAAPVTVDPNATNRGLQAGFEAARRRDEDRRSREGPHPAPPAATTVRDPVPASDLPPADEIPTPQHVYVSCYGMARDHQGETCALAGMIAVRYREGPGEGPRFCLPDTAEIRANVTLAMGYAYLDFYDRTAPQNLTEDGFLAFIAALIDKWPCPTQ